MQRRITILLSLMILLCFVSACNLRNSDNTNGGSVEIRREENVTGGGCSYKDFKGTATIKEVRPISGSNNLTKKFNVSYIFETDAPDAPERVKHISRELSLTKQEIERKQIKAGKQFPAAASYQVSGTCSPGPFLYEFEKSLSAAGER